MKKTKCWVNTFLNESRAGKHVQSEAKEMDERRFRMVWKGVSGEQDLSS